MRSQVRLSDSGAYPSALANGALLPTGRANEGGWLAMLACRIVIEPRSRALGVSNQRRLRLSVSEVCSRIERSSVDITRIVDEILRFDDAADRIKMLEFYEPVSVLERREDGSTSHVELDHILLVAWTCHMAHSMYSRLRSLEPGVLREISEGRLLTASTLLRAHLEASAMAALCFVRLSQFRGQMESEPLTRLVGRTLFGTALTNRAKKDDRVQEMLTFAEQRTPTITEALEAFDQFLYQSTASGTTQILYSLLCEFAHPNHRGTRGFVEYSEVEPEGWIVRYNLTERLESEFIEGTLSGLSRSMRGGYAAIELLLATDFSDEKPHYLGVAEPVGMSIWNRYFADG